MKHALILLILLSTISCWPDEPFVPNFGDGLRMGYKPIYEDEVDLEIGLVEARPFVNVGQIYVFDTLVMLVEQNEGIHIINNSDIENPNKAGFFKVFGCQQLAIKDGVLYTNQFTDLIAIDISDIQNPRVIAEDRQVLSNNAFNNNVPPGIENYFECPDPEKGRIIAWQYTQLNSPKCYK